MNKEYTYIDGKVIIRDEKGSQRPDDYYDNLDDVLVQENLIETMENRIAELEKESKKYKKYNKKRYIPTIFPMVTLMTTIGAPVLFYLLTGTNPLTISTDTVFGVQNLAVSLSTIFSMIFIPIGALVDVALYRQHKDFLKTADGVDSELEFLQKQLVDEKKELEELKEDKTRDREVTTFRVVTVDDKQQISLLKNYLSFYFNLGYNVRKYYRYYQQGLLDEKLKKSFTPDGIEAAKEYLEEKGPTLAKTRKQQKRDSL